MTSLPIEFVPIKYEGYYLNLINMNLYSLKRSGVLSQLKHHRASHFRRKSGYSVSVDGQTGSVSDVYLEALALKENEKRTEKIIPVVNKYDLDTGLSLKPVLT